MEQHFESAPSCLRVVGCGDEHANPVCEYDRALLAFVPDDSGLLVIGFKEIEKVASWNEDAVVLHDAVFGQFVEDAAFNRLFEHSEHILIVHLLVKARSPNRRHVLP